jgi:DNA primase
VAEEWFSYKDLAERLGISSEAVRQKAIRYRWPKRMNNRGKAEVLVDLVEVRDQMEVSPPRKPKDESPSDPRPTPAEPPSDTAQALAALEGHIASLKEMVAKAEALTDRERARADEERARADRLQVRLDELMAERVSDTRRVAKVEAAIGELRAAMVERAARRWWKRLAG